MEGQSATTTTATEWREKLEERARRLSAMLRSGEQNVGGILEFAKDLFNYGVKNNSILPQDDDEDDDEEEEGELDDGDDGENDGEDADGDDDDVDNNADGAAPEMDTRLYQFDMEEEEDIDASNDDSHGENSHDDLFAGIFDGNVFERVIDILDSLTPAQVTAMKTQAFLLKGDCHLELEDFNESMRQYLAAIEGEKDLNQMITIYLRLCEAAKWAQHTKYPWFVESAIALLEQRINSDLSADAAADRRLLEDLREDLQDAESANEDIRVKHPEFDSILKRALGQMVQYDEQTEGKAVDLTNLVVKKRKRK
ncbi:Hif1p KNAG_0I03020 [Huiozyma naganishii CBS 8797]|uniref:Tetratricopeptide SHNi-TPR domain-containing protein n=1 Tax=Huiozyma naganishii (strain ATCC MYA-139 / BCRC 22969 / CBS 8797 / KCTC 17520 / NBRC 10181 / NCYC 3082 / Yp74L-3) TaxID=1071383 RepID=J7SAE3_HUIN7|nr:hypothetical protein KNAG_0I03020 [Kazachstania naganishii CBS 8797]CCK72086.1 hypothetical protein KNAG_0I03020 [Kazachstania naganishii CBS 8797]